MGRFIGSGIASKLIPIHNQLYLFRPSPLGDLCKNEK